MSFLRNEDGYGMFDFLKDYTLGDSVTRDHEYAAVIKRTLADDPSMTATVVVGKLHAKPIADILNNEYQPPENIKGVIQNVRDYIYR